MVEKISIIPGMDPVRWKRQKDRVHLGQLSDTEMCDSKSHETEITNYSWCQQITEMVH